MDLSEHPETGSSEGELRRSRFDQLRVFTLSMSIVSAVMATALWAWDRAIDPGAAPGTLVSRIFMGAVLLPVPLAILVRAPLPVIAGLLYAGLLVGEALFLDLLGVLHGGEMIGMVGFMYLFLGTPLLTLGLPVRWNIAGTAALLLAPLLLAEPQGLTPLPGFEPVRYLLLFTPVFCMIVLAQVLMDRVLRSAHDLRRQLEVRTVAMDGAAEAVVITDREGRIEYTNPAFTRMTGYEASEVLGQNPRILRSGRQAPEVYRDLWETILRGETWRGELENRRKQGTIYQEHMSIAPLLGPDGRPRRFVAIKRDVTLQKDLEARLERLAHYDALTGLPNRVLFLDRLGQAVREASRTQERLGLLFVDLDGFKDVNDSHGHEVGDALLCEVARRLTETLRSADSVGRMGGDEFTVILRDLGRLQNASRVADKLLGALSLPIQAGGKVCTVSASIGIAVFPEHGQNLDRLLAAADAAMYQVKHHGKRGHRLSSEQPAVQPRVGASPGA